MNYTYGNHALKSGIPISAKKWLRPKRSNAKIHSVKTSEEIKQSNTPGSGRCYSKQEIRAFVAARPDLLKLGRKVEVPKYYAKT